MKTSNRTVLLDIDNTILNIDSLKQEESAIIDANYGEGANKNFWEVYKEVTK